MPDTRPAELTEAVQVASNWLAVMKHSFVPRRPITDSSSDGRATSGSRHTWPAFSPSLDQLPRSLAKVVQGLRSKARDFLRFEQADIARAFLKVSDVAGSYGEARCLPYS